MDPASQDDLAIRSAALPFVVSWKDLDKNAEVLSLDADQLGWDALLAGQGIKLRTGIDADKDQWSVITKFDAQEVIAANKLKAWASKRIQSLKPGGLLILGGSLPRKTLPNLHSVPPETVEYILRDAGFVRAKAILPSLDPGNKSLHAALYGTSQQFVVIAQKHGVGKKFDVFSPSFLQFTTLSPQERLKRAEEELHAREAALDKRIDHIDRGLLEPADTLRDKITSLEDTLDERIRRSEAALDDQAEKIVRLRSEIEELRLRLKRATRRRGLRKLAYEIRKKLRPKTQTTTPPETEPQVIPPQKPETVVREIQPTPDPTQPTTRTTLESVDPVPLSPYEVALRRRLFEEQDT